MSSGGALTIPCSQHPTQTPLDVRTFTRNTVGSTHCEVDSSRIAKQVVQLKLSPQGTPIKAHLKIACVGSELVLTDVNGNNKRTVECENNVTVGNQKVELSFHFKQRNKSLRSTAEKIHIDIWHSGQDEVPEDADEDLLSNTNYWGQLDPEINLA
jgi:hypothetical protein